MQSKEPILPSGTNHATWFQRILLTLLNWTGYSSEPLTSDLQCPSLLDGGAIFGPSMYLPLNLSDEELLAIFEMGEALEERFRQAASSDSKSGTDVSGRVWASGSRLKH